MKLRHQFQTQLTVQMLFENHYEDNKYKEDNSLFLVDLVHVFRPKKPYLNNEVSIVELINFLTLNPEHCSQLKFFF